MVKKVVVFITIVALILILSGCGSSQISGRISGRFISVDNSLEYLVFEGNRVALYEDGIQIWSSTFIESTRTSDDVYFIIIEAGGALLTSLRFWTDVNKETIFSNIRDGNLNFVGDIAFVKEN